MNINKLKNSFWLLFLIALASCEKVIDMEIDKKEPKLVVISYLTPDSLINVHVSKSIHILETDTISLIRNASVLVFEDNTLIDSLRFNPFLGTYRSIFKKPFTGKQYRLEVSCNGYKSVSAQCVVPVPVEITSLDTFVRKATMVDPGSPYYIDNSYSDFVFKISFNDPAAVENFYILSITQKNYDTLFMYQQEDYFNKSQFSIKSMVVEYSSYDSFLNFYPENNDDGLMGSESETRTIYASQVAFSDKLFDGKQASFELAIGNIVYNDFIKYSVTLTSVSEEYYRYIVAESLYSTSDDPFSERVQMYSNITNGLGLLMSSSSAEKSVIRKKNYTYQDYKYE